MKAKLFMRYSILLLFLVCGNIKAVTIYSLKTLPQYPVESDEVSIICHTIFPNREVYLDSTNIYYNPGNDTISIDAFYSMGDLTTPGGSIDTIGLGCPGAGDYVVRLRAFENFHINEGSISDTVYVNFRVYRIMNESQVGIYILSNSFVPEYPNQNSVTSFILQVGTPSSPLDLNSFFICEKNATFRLHAFYSKGDATFPGLRTDTIELVKSDPGKYVLISFLHLNNSINIVADTTLFTVYDESSFSYFIDSLSLVPVEPDTMHHVRLMAYTSFENLDETLDSVDFDTTGFMNVRIYYSTEPGSGTHQRTDEVDFSLETPGNFEMAFSAINTTALGEVREVLDTARLVMSLPETPVQKLVQSHETAGFTIYPNPAGSSVMVSFETEPDPSCCIDLYSPDGRMIAHLQVRDNPFRLDLNNYPPGVYYLVIRNERKIIGADKVIRL